ncbi:MAG TPA: FliA/WhiG family RNA polymerase sigma factor [Balneolales bacterium]|nr:FliA/WhiG family RNA polymerase sigma factor [Balneolales bacterium]
MTDSLQELVTAYCESPTPALRHAIITKAMPLVRSIVGKINRPDTPLSQYEDLVSAGIVGLLQALDSYDTTKNVQFNTFAYYRIRGNVIDYLRKIDKMPRFQRNMYGKAQEAMERLMQRLGREPEDDEIACELEITVDEYNNLLVNVQQRAILSLDDRKYTDSDGDRLSDHIEDENIVSPSYDIEKQTLYSHLAEEIKKLKERDQMVLAMYYYEEMTLNEIAQVLGLTEARISQIIGKLLLQLRGVLQKEAEFKYY